MKKIETVTLAPAANFRFPPFTSIMPHLRTVSEQVLRTADSQHGGLSVWTKTLGQKMVVKYGGFCQGQKRLSFVSNCNHNEPTGDLQACHSKPSLFAGATSCSALSRPPATIPNAAVRPVEAVTRASCSILSAETSVCGQTGPMRVQQNSL